MSEVVKLKSVNIELSFSGIWDFDDGTGVFAVGSEKREVENWRSSSWIRVSNSEIFKRLQKKFLSKKTNLKFFFPYSNF